MTISGKSLIAGQWLGDTSHGFYAFNPQLNKPMDYLINETNPKDLATAIARAQEAFTSYSQLDAMHRAKLLKIIGEQILALGDELIEVACAETGLPEARIIGERGRTIGQLNLFAQQLLEQEYLPVIERADTGREPLPKPDTRLGYLPIGVVGVFGASNFPLAFSTAGGDTASALAAGCPVVMKAHVAHPGTAELVARAISHAIELCDIDAGVFSLIQGKDYALSTQLVQHPFVKAIGFTGSERVGMILQTQINERPDPIPFYGELGSLNPQFILPSVIEVKATQTAAMFVNSLMMGQGQFCTSPGLWVVIKDSHYHSFEQAAISELSKQAAGVMLTPEIKAAYDSSVDKWNSLSGVECLARGQQGKPFECQAALFQCDLNTFIDNKVLQDEVFGPAALIITCEDDSQMAQLVSLLKGNLTATIHAESSDFLLAESLCNSLSHKVGRLIFNQMPTGVEVCSAMNHGGPFPASTDVRTTSVGSKAIERFRRPICYQNLPQDFLPALLKG
jgi:2,5-dioxopentanoate dehydrogenase